MEIATLEHMQREQLLDHWCNLFGSPPPRGLSRPFLRRFIAFELQTRRSGGLTREVTRKLMRQEHGKSTAQTPALKPGGRLLREWNGVTHIVDVTDSGFVWNGTPYRSLSAIARAITGAHWSGPRFFGVTGKDAG